MNKQKNINCILDKIKDNTSNKKGSECSINGKNMNYKFII